MAVAPSDLIFAFLQQFHFCECVVHALPIELQQQNPLYHPTCYIVECRTEMYKRNHRIKERSNKINSSLIVQSTHIEAKS